MPDTTVERVLFFALQVHGIGHVGPLGTLAFLKWRPNTNTGGCGLARSWLLPSLSKSAAAAVASVFGIVALVGFVLVALSFRGVLVSGDVWRPLALVPAAVSSLGIVLFFRTWPMRNTAAALGMNVLAVGLSVAWPF